MKGVTIIPATLNKFTAMPVNNEERLKVAAYARVSTDEKEQLTSYSAQVDYYTNYIKGHSDWEFVSVYTDEGISGTSMKNREGFKQMIKDALDGKIQLIVTKSISRFARNTVDSLETIRKLKENGIEVYFEKENIRTFDAKVELITAIMASIAQEESRSISENITWGFRKKFAEGKFTMPYKSFLGYTRGENGGLEIDEKEAAIVRKIYRLFLEGLTPYSIAKQLTKEEIPTPTGKRKWQQSTVKSILTNEKYKGDALLQKYYTQDFLSKKKRANKGEVQQYYIENSHKGIVSREIFDTVQREMERRKGIGYSGVDIFSSKIICGCCGGFYGAKIYHSTDKYRAVIYRCNRRSEYKCDTPNLREEEIKRLFIQAVNKTAADKDELIENIEIIRKAVCQTTEEGKENTKEMKNERIKNFLEGLKNQNGVIAEFDDRLWGSLVDTVTVYNKEDIRFKFKEILIKQVY